MKSVIIDWDPVAERFVSEGGGKHLEQRIGELATALDHNDAFVIFPEGGNFTQRRRLAAHLRRSTRLAAQQPGSRRGSRIPVTPAADGRVEASR